MRELGNNFQERKSGVLMPLRALPGDHDHQGTYGPESIDFLDYMRRAGFTAWQDLPLSVPDPFDSPYSSVSAFAIDPQRIDLYQLAEVGDINRFDLDRYQKLVQTGDAGREVREEKKALLRSAFLEFSDNGSPERHAAFGDWYSEEAQWLDYFAAYEILESHKDNINDQGEKEWRWQHWKVGKEYSKKLIADIKAAYPEDFSAICYEQWIAEEQTLRYIEEAKRRGIEVWSDVPFYTAGAEVWANRQVFNLCPEGHQLNQGGAEQSVTSATGQMWGFATYNHGGGDEEQMTRVVDWYSKRLARAVKLSGGKVRLDHFIGQAEPWIVRAGAVNGLDGYRDEGIGHSLLTHETHIYGRDLPYYPEDLGTQTPKTAELRDAFGLAANTLAVRGLTKCLINRDYQGSIHNPDNYRPNSVSFTSNHDMLPLVGAFEKVRSEHPYALDDYVTYTNGRAPHEKFTAATPSKKLACYIMEHIIHSDSQYAFAAVWDILEAGSEWQYNIPNTIQLSNWSRRMSSDEMNDLYSKAPYWRQLSQSSGRSQEIIATAAD